MGNRVERQVVCQKPLLDVARLSAVLVPGGTATQKAEEQHQKKNRPPIPRRACWGVCSEVRHLMLPLRHGIRYA